MKALAHKSHTAFTIIELLVVIAILAILMSLLAPVLASARSRVQGYSCQANLRQIGTASLLYAQDYDDQFACRRTEASAWLPDLHHPYLKQWRIWICPTDANARVWDGVWNSASGAVRTSYSWNAYIFQGDSSDWRRSLSQSAVSTSATTVLWSEIGANSGWRTDALPPSSPEPGEAFLHNLYGDNVNTMPSDTTAAPCRARLEKPHDTAHVGGGNYVFVDGHSKWAKASKFTTDAFQQSRGALFSDPSDPFLTNGARNAARSLQCPVFCCPQAVGMPPGDGTHPWFRP